MSAPTFDSDFEDGVAEALAWALVALVFVLLFGKSFGARL